MYEVSLCLTFFYKCHINKRALWTHRTSKTPLNVLAFFVDPLELLLWTLDIDFGL